jgi:hypothetical protein
LFIPEKNSKEIILKVNVWIDAMKYQTRA